MTGEKFTASVYENLKEFVCPSRVLNLICIGTFLCIFYGERKALIERLSLRQNSH